MTGMETLEKLRSERNWRGVYVMAVWLWSRENSVALEDLRTGLGIAGTVDVVDDALRAAAQDRYDELLQWCIHTAARLDGTSVKNPATWLPGTVRYFENTHAVGGDLTGLLRHIETTDELLAAAAGEDLIEAAPHVRHYQAVRERIFRALAA